MIFPGTETGFEGGRGNEGLFPSRKERFEEILKHDVLVFLNIWISSFKSSK